tara:strand:- start:117 stop:338 length:222 start_codon:yes stop_codon:yes gene_type:complete
MEIKNYAGMALGKPGAFTGRSEHATPAALPAPLGSRDFYEKTNPYWLQQAASRKRGRVGPQGRKVASLTNKKQ